MLKSLGYVRVLGVATQGGASYMSIWEANSSLLQLDRQFLLKIAFLANSTSCIARECRAKPKNHNLSYKKKLLEPGQTDKQTTVTLSRMRRGLISST